MKKTTHFMSVFVTGSFAIGCLAVVGNAQVISPTEDVTVPVITVGASSENPGATGIERANNPFSADSYESLGMRQERFSEAAGVPAYGTSQPSSNGTPSSLVATSSVAKALNVRVTVSVIQSAGYNLRNEVQKYVIARVAGGDVAMDDIVQRGSDRLTGETRAQALRKAARSRMNLMASLRNAGPVSEGDWAQVRTELANRYQRYADAVIHVESVATGRVASAGGVPPAGSLLASAR